MVLIPVRTHCIGLLKVNEMIVIPVHGGCKHNRQVAEQKFLFYYLFT